MNFWAQAGLMAVDWLTGNSAAEEQMDFNAEQAAKNRAFQERMSNTEVQRRKADLEKAGFNPMMAVMNNAASAPSGSTASGASAPRSDFLGAYTSAQLTKEQVKLADAQRQKTQAEADLIRSQVPHSGAAAAAQADKLNAEAMEIGQRIEKLSYEIQSAKVTSEQVAQMMPLLLEAQRLANSATRMGLSKKEVEENVAKTLNIPFDKAEEAVSLLGGIGSKIGISAAEFVEKLKLWWIDKKPRHWR